MSFTGIHHLVIRVNDLEASIAHWTKNLGLTLSRRQTNESLGVNQAIFDLPDGGFIELVSPIDENSPMTKTLASLGEGIQLVSLSVDDVAAQLTELAGNGIRIVGDEGGPNFVHPKSASGVMLGISAQESK